MSCRALEIILYPEHPEVTKEYIMNVWNDHKDVIDKAYGILHDKDVLLEDATNEDGTIKARKGDHKKDHYHVYLKFRTDKNQQADAVLKWFGEDYGVTRKLDARKYKNAVRYGTHETAQAKKDKKHQYDRDEAFATFNINEMLDDPEYREENEARGLETILKRIEKGEIWRSNLIHEISTVEYALYKSKIDSALDFEEKKKWQKINNEGVSMEIMYLWGESRTGKTTYAKEYAKQRGYDFFVAGSSNDPLDGYNGERCLILDDLRGSSFSFSDLLKMLDPHTVSSVKSRYKNKIRLCDLILITSIRPIEELYTSEDLQGEPLMQLKARCLDVLHFTEKEIEWKRYSEVRKEYDVVCCIPNVYTKMRKTSDLTDAQLQDRAMELFGMMGISAQQVSEYWVKNAKELRAQLEKEKREREAKEAQTIKEKGDACEALFFKEHPEYKDTIDDIVYFEDSSVHIFVRHYTSGAPLPYYVQKYAPREGAPS